MAEPWETLIVERDAGVADRDPEPPRAQERRQRDHVARAARPCSTTWRPTAPSGCLVLDGRRRALLLGADLSDPTDVAGRPGDPYLLQMRALGDVALRLHRFPKPTIAKVGGVAAGAGMSMAIGCDLVVASESARFSQIFAKRGLSVDFGASWLLPRLIGLHRAKELAFFADILSADEAAEFGLVNRVVPDDDLDGFVDDWARRLAEGPTLALSLTKTLLEQFDGRVSMEQALEDEARAQAANFGTRDTREALTAFVERRPPDFEGR